MGIAQRTPNLQQHRALKKRLCPLTRAFPKATAGPGRPGPSPALRGPGDPSPAEPAFPWAPARSRDIRPAPRILTGGCQHRVPGLCGPCVPSAGSSVTATAAALVQATGRRAAVSSYPPTPRAPFFFLFKETGPSPTFGFNNAAKCGLVAPTGGTEDSKCITSSVHITKLHLGGRHGYQEIISLGHWYT